MTDDEGMGTEAEHGIPLWAALAFIVLALAGFAVAVLA